MANPPPLYDIGIVFCYPILTEIRFRGMLYHAREPYAIHAQFLDMTQQLGRKVVELAAPVLLQRAPRDAIGIGVGEYSWEKLVDDQFFFANAHD